MALCPSACAPSLPESPTGGCGVTIRQGGISRLAFIKCDFEFDDITDPAEWETAITAGNIVLTGLLLGNKPKGTFTKKRLSSCAPEAVIGGEKTVAFQDYNNDPAECKDIEFWNTIQANATKYRFGYYTCDGYFYGVIDSFQIEVDQVIEDNNTGAIYYDGTITWNATQMPCGYEIDLNGK